MRFKQKKGDAVDMLIIVISIFFLSIIFLTYWYFTTTTATALASTPINTTETQAGIASLNMLGTTGASNGFIMIFGALILGLLLSSFFIDQHPIFIPIYIVLLIVTIIMAVFLGNAYAQITDPSIANNPFADAAAAQPVIDAVMRNIVRIALGAGLLSMLIVFGKIAKASGGP